MIALESSGRVSKFSVEIEGGMGKRFGPAVSERST